MKTRSPVTTHVLDVSKGKPALKVPVVLEVQSSSGVWKTLGQGTTNSDGRVEDLLKEGSKIKAGLYRLSFDVKKYFEGLKADSFYPEVSITFKVEKTNEHYHVPLLLSPFGYSTYRGS